MPIILEEWGNYWLGRGESQQRGFMPEGGLVNRIWGKKAKGKKAKKAKEKQLKTKIGVDSLSRWCLNQKLERGCKRKKKGKGMEEVRTFNSSSTEGEECWNFRKKTQALVELFRRRDGKIIGRQQEWSG